MIHRHEDGSIDRNLFLQVTLGLISAAAAFKRLIADAEPRQSDRRSEDESIDPILHLVLGLVVVAERLRVFLDPILDEATVSGVSTAPPAQLRDSNLRGWLA